MCPTCSHTMQKVGEWYWCPRCGSLKPFGRREAEPPKLVARVQEWLGETAEEATAHRLGIIESVFSPNARVKGAHVDGERRANE